MKKIWLEDKKMGADARGVFFTRVVKSFDEN
jgi:hypothetical protein